MTIDLESGVQRQCRSGSGFSRTILLGLCGQLKPPWDLNLQTVARRGQQPGNWHSLGKLFLVRFAAEIATHIYRQHGVKHPARYLVDGTSCPICLLEFHTRTRLIAHIANKSTVCCSNLKCRMQPFSEAVVAQMDDEAKVCEKANKRSGWRRGRAHEPCIRLSGPLWPIIPIAENEFGNVAHPLGYGHRWMRATS